MRTIAALLTLSFVGFVVAQDLPKEAPKETPKDSVPEASKIEPKVDYSEISKVIRGLVLKPASKEFKDESAWNLSKPFPPKLRLPNLPRTTIKVGDEVQLAHGTWKKVKVWMENPDRDLALAVTDIKAIEPTKHRVFVTSDAPLLVDFELQQWLNGLMLVGVSGRAKARVRVDVECDATLGLDVAKFPPEVTVDPKIVAAKVTLEQFDVFDPGTARRPGLVADLNEQIRSVVQTMLVGAEPQICDEANRAIAKALKEGKGSFSASKLLGSIKK